MPKKQHPHSSRKVETLKGQCNLYTVLLLALSSKKHLARLLVLITAVTICALILVTATGIVVVYAPSFLKGFVTVDFSVFGAHPD